jgi:Protein of unknown function (DUF4256)
MSGIRKLGGALFVDRRYNTVFVYHNGASSYFGGRAFRGSLRSEHGQLTGFAEAIQSKRLNTTCYSASWKNGSSLSFASVSRRLDGLA